jgi:hypothetical protein
LPVAEAIDVQAEVLDRDLSETKVCTTYSGGKGYLQYVNYRSEGDTRLTINGSRHYKTPYGTLPSVTTILSATQGNKASLERWNKKNPGKREEAAARGTAVHSRMEYYLLGQREFEYNEIVEPFWEGLPEKLDKFEDVIWAENPVDDHYSWTIGGDGVSRVWHPGVNEEEQWGWAGAPDIIATYQGKVILGDLKTSNGFYYGKWPGPETPRDEYGMRRAGFVKYQKCCMQLAAYDMAIQETIGIKPDIHMILVATKERPQTFAIQGRTIQKYKDKWLQAVEKYYTEFHNKPEIDMEAVDGDKEKEG